MPFTEGLEALIGKKGRITDTEWLVLIEARRKLIKPHLDSFTLPILGSLKCLRNELSFKHEIDCDISVSGGDQRFSLKTQGFFWAQPWSAVERISNSGSCNWPGYVACPDGTMHIWGLTRSGLWVLVTIEFVGESGYKERGYERAKSVKIFEADLRAIIEKTKENPRHMWSHLGAVIKSFAERRKCLYNQALDLARMVEIEELALSIVLGK
ncbi:MAG: hypothetical protein A2931_00595 [Candidatus Niyogibacteria bacterium RIFCSPLOWO2_01_FULL_45_48]|uniref:Uncharacterized protein n=2 Tax=Candidatus Niyogiibacteriota TaxID=1817912 RepID=A0A1G2F235_9BACT|nr:MAG: hypothetical protein A2931_00595 [Candidatus Niyogibacteria bacterium RIFCSPLOWO2_01_FULL_45_48]OGZ30043.1 MAG: hypothetical protein A2835_03455 [Candidatus Niyogibacteria bacterium RIFCSPHIGHO2_01_FULL_45_28]OGZ31621.1 MAG: hypothetical protein A3J00_00205 [Candidatus Niyogibacteria bacterium RIFCSPLOWO2_02_FULL_45_13]